MCQGQIIHDYVLGMCYVIPCEYMEYSMNYFERLQELGLLV